MENISPIKLLVVIVNCDHFKGFLFQWRHSVFRFPLWSIEQSKNNEVNEFDDAQWNVQIHSKQSAAKCEEIDDYDRSLNSFVYFYFFEFNSYDSHKRPLKFVLKWHQIVKSMLELIVFLLRTFIFRTQLSQHVWCIRCSRSTHFSSLKLNKLRRRRMVAIYRLCDLV